MEAFVFTKTPIKGTYTLLYKAEYGRYQSKWGEPISNYVHKSWGVTLEYCFGLQN